MQPQQPLAAPPGRGRTVAIVLLAVGLLVASIIAAVEYVQLREAQARIEELESRGEGGGGGLLGELGDIFEDAFGELGEGLGGGGSQGLLGCLFPDQPFSGSPVVGTEEEQVQAIANQVERLRELEFTDPVEPEFVSPQESADLVQDLFLEEYTEAIGDVEERLLTTLGAIPAGTDLRSLRSDLLGQQVAGFYDPETGQLVVRQADQDLSPTDRVVLAHELDHALTDQALGIPVPDDLRAGREDADLAGSSLAEGDATLLMQQFSASLPLDEQLQGLDPSAFTEAIQAQADLATLPPYLQSELTFPYEDGLTFACDLYQEGGWAAVDRAYRDAPDSTLEVLFPDRYREGFAPVDVRAPEIRLKAWRATATVQVGAAPLLWLFQAPGGDPDAALADPRASVEAWAGGEVHLWTNGPDTAVAMLLA
ncbi:MAG: hypothetical protein ACRDHB_01240, partial [Actinomycetota bacterium]